MNVSRFTSCFLLAAFVWVSGCATQTPDPLAGWKQCSSNDPICSNKTIIDDYQDFIQKLPPKERDSVRAFESLRIHGIKFFEDGTGQHAVDIEVDSNRPLWKTHRHYVSTFSRGQGWKTDFSSVIPPNKIAAGNSHRTC